MPFLELFDAPDPCDCYRRTAIGGAAAGAGADQQRLAAAT